MKIESLWEQNKIEAVIADHLQNISKELELPKEQFNAISQSLSAERTIPIQVANKIFDLSIHLPHLKNFTEISFVDHHNKILATLKHANNEYELLIPEEDYVANVVINLNGIDSLTIKSRSKLLLSGNVKAKNKIQIDCQECEIQSNQIITKNKIISALTSLESETLTLRCINNVTLHKKVQIKTHKETYISAAQVNNEAYITVPSLILVTEKFNNNGELSIAIDFSGYFLDFINEKNGSIQSNHLVSLSTYKYINRGSFTTKKFNLLASEVVLYGLLIVHQYGEILADKDFQFFAEALVESKGRLILKCNNAIHLDGRLTHCNDVLEVSGKIVNLKGFINTTKSTVILTAEEILNLDGIVNSDEISHLYLESTDININNRIIRFNNIEMKAKNNLKINDFLSNEGSLTLIAKDTYITAIVSAQGPFSLHTKLITVSDSGKIFLKDQGRIICDVLYNDGEIFSQASLYFGVNYLYCNRGAVTAKVLDIDAVIYADFWSIAGEHIKINALVLLSVGFIYAGQYQSNALIECKSGLHLSKLPSFKELFSGNNLIECAKLAAKQIIPQSFQAVQLAMQVYKTLVPFFSKGIVELQEIYHSLSKIELNNLQLHQLIGYIVKVKDSGLLMKGNWETLNAAKNNRDKFAVELNNLKLLLDKHNFHKFITDIQTKQVLINSIPVVLATNLSDSIASFSSGIAITTQNANRSFYTHRQAFQAALSTVTFNSKILHNEGGLFTLGNINLAGNEFKSDSSIIGLGTTKVDFHQIELIASSPMSIRNWQINDAENVIIKNFQVHDSQINAASISLSENQMNACQLQSKEDIIVETSTITDSALFGNNVIVTTSNISRSKMNAENTLTVNGKSQLKHSELKSLNEVVVKDNLDVEYINIHGKKVTLDADIHAIGKKINEAVSLTINASEKLRTENNGKITAESLDVKCHIFENLSSIVVSDDFEVLADRMVNHARIAGGNRTQFNVNQALVNLDYITSNNTSINAGLFVNCCHMVGYDSLNINALASFNIGLIRSSNVRVNAVLSYNFGAYLPSLPSSPESFITWGNAANIGKTLLYNVSPTIGSVAGIGLSAYRLYHSGVSLGKTVLKSSPKNLSEIIAITVGSMDLINGIKNSCTGNKSEKNSDNSNSGYSDLTSTITSMIVPNVTTTSLVDINQGHVYSGNITNSAVYSRNDGSQNAFKAYSSTSYFQTNNGIINAQTCKINGNKFDNKGKVCATQADLTLNEWNQSKGSVHFQHGKINVTNFSMTGGDVFLEATSTKIGGTLYVDQSAKLILEKGSQLNIQKATIDGVLDATSQSSITATESNINGKINLYDAEMQSTNVYIESTGEIAVSQSSELKADLILNAGKLMGKTNSDVKTQNYISTHASETHLNQSKIISENNIEIHGKLDASNNSVLEAKNTLVTGKNAALNLYEGTVKAQNAEIAGNAEFDKTTVDVTNKLDTTKFAQIILKNASKLTVKEAQLDGSIEASQKSNITIIGNTEIKGEIKLIDADAKTGGLHIHSEGALFATEGSTLQAELTTNEGKFEVHNSTVSLENYVGTQGSKNSLDQSIMISENKIDISGSLSATSSNIKATHNVKLNQDTIAKLENSVIESQNIQTEAQLEVHGKSALIAEDRLDVGGSIKGTGIAELHGNSGTLSSDVSSRGLAIDIKQLENVHSLVYGNNEYENVKPADYLLIVTPDQLHLEKPLTRSCATDVIASDIQVDAPITMDKTISLQTIQGPLLINSNITSREDIILDSAKEIINRKAAVKAGKTVSLKTQKDNLDNIGGTFQGTEYLYTDINGDINNIADEKWVRNEFDSAKQFIPAQFIGGTGDQHEGIGACINSTGQFINDASCVKSSGRNIINAGKGYVGKTRTHTYLSENSKKRGFFSGYSKKAYSVNLGVSEVVSTNSGNIINVENEIISAESSGFISKDGTDLFGHHGVNVDGKIIKSRTEEENYSWFGLSKSSSDKTHETVVPSLIYDQGKSKIYSKEGNVNIRNTSLLGSGTSFLQGKNVNVVSQKLNHTTSGYRQTFAIDVFGRTTLSSLKEGGASVHTLLQEDPTIAKFSHLCTSANPLELASNSWNSALSAYNSYQTLAQTNNLSSALLQRYGLGNQQGFNPTVTLTFNAETYNGQYETLAPNCIARNELEIIAEKEVNLVGTPVDIAGNAIIKAKKFSQSGVSLSSQASSEIVSLSLGATCKGDILSVGAGYQHQQNQQTHHSTQQLNISGTLNINSDEWNLENASTEAKNITGNVNHVNTRSHQDIYKRSNISFSASTDGRVSAFVSERQGVQVQKKNGITIHEANSTDMPPLAINQLSLVDSEWKLADENNAIVNTKTERHNENVEQKYSYGLLTNIKDFIPNSRPTPNQDIVSNPLPTANIQYENNEMKLTLDVPTFFGKKVLPSNTESENPPHSTLSEPEIMLADNFDTEVSVIEKTAKPKWNASFFAKKSPQQRLNHVIESKEDKWNPLILTAAAEESENKIKRIDLKMKTQDVRISTKQGANGANQTFDIDNGQYCNTKNILNKIQSKNNRKQLHTHETKLSFKKDFLKTHDEIYWESDYLDPYKIIKPMLTDDNGRCYLSAEINTANQLKAKFEVGREIRCNLLQGNFDANYLGKYQYAIDLASIQANWRCIASNDRGINFETCIEGGIVGPSAVASYSSPEISLFGLTLQSDASMRGGFGAKAGVGAGITLDKTKLQVRPYAKLGVWFGPGFETELKANVGIDTELPKRYRQAQEQYINHPFFKKALDDIRRSKAAVEREQPSSFFGKLIQAYKIDCYETSEQELLESLGVAAFSQACCNFNI